MKFRSGSDGEIPRRCKTKSVFHGLLVTGVHPCGALVATARRLSAYALAERHLCGCPFLPGQLTVCRLQVAVFRVSHAACRQAVMVVHGLFFEDGSRFQAHPVAVFAAPADKLFDLPAEFAVRTFHGVHLFFLPSPSLPSCACSGQAFRARYSWRFPLSGSPPGGPVPRRDGVPVVR